MADIQDVPVEHTHIAHAPHATDNICIATFFPDSWERGNAAITDVQGYVGCIMEGQTPVEPRRRRAAR